MNIRNALLASLALATVLTACSKTDHATASAPAAAGVSAGWAARPTASTQSIIGVAECDDYIAKARMCVASKVPEAQRAHMESAINLQSDAFMQGRNTSPSKAMLASKCKAATDQARSTYAAYGCSM